MNLHKTLCPPPRHRIVTYFIVIFREKFSLPAILFCAAARQAP
jgi:hypothetical protein